MNRPFVTFILPTIGRYELGRAVASIETQSNKDYELIIVNDSGENKLDYFGIRYEYESNIFTFYPDYLLQMKDGRVGILEVKDESDRDGKTLTKAKAESLQSWLAKQKRKGLFGGIVIEKGKTWLINSQKTYDWGKCERGDWGDWIKFE